MNLRLQTPSGDASKMQLANYNECAILFLSFLASCTGALRFENKTTSNISGNGRIVETASRIKGLQ